MKTIIRGLAVLAALAAPGAAALEAQEAKLGPEPTEHYGIKGGVSAAWLRNDDPTMDERFAPIAGVFASMQSGGLVGLQAEALFSGKGYKSDGRTVELWYVELPVLLTLKLPGLGPVRPYVVAGPAPALRVRSMYGTARKATQDVFAGNLRRWDVGLVGGLALDVSLPRGGLILEGRCNLGLLSPFVADSSYASGGDRNRSVVGLLGYRF